MALKSTISEVSQLRRNVMSSKKRGEPQALELPLEPVIQRPNAVPNNGGPQLLRGLMLPLPPSKNRASRAMPMLRKGMTFPVKFLNFKEMVGKMRAIEFPSDDAKEYFRTIANTAVERRFRFGTTKDLRIDVLVCPRNRAQIDPANYAEVLFDAMQEAQVFEDDRQLKDTRVRLGPIMQDGRVIVSLWEINHDPNALLKEMWG